MVLARANGFIAAVRHKAARCGGWVAQPPGPAVMARFGQRTPGVEGRLAAARP
jgi:hypothetical protein